MSSSISLRTFTISDLDDFMAWASDDEVSKFCTWDTFTNKQDLLNYITQTVLPHPWCKAICLHGKPVGYILFTRSNIERCKGELGYVLASEYWGRGIATKAVKMVVGMVFGESQGLERVEAWVDVENSGSQRVLEKAGFTKEAVMRKCMIFKGRYRDMVMYSFLSTE